MSNLQSQMSPRVPNSTGFSGYTAVVSASTPSGGVNVYFGSYYGNSPQYPIPGYLDDFGDAYGDRGNGYSYGWDSNLTASGTLGQARQFA